MKKWVILVLAALLLASGFFCGRRSRADKDSIVTIIRDTTFVYDTIVRIKPEPVTRRVVDSVLVPVRDVQVIRDTVYVNVPIESKYYKGDNYEAWVSGYCASLDRINIYGQTRIISERVQSYSHHLGVSMNGFYVGGNANIPIGLDYSYSKGRYLVGATIGYDVFSNNFYVSSRVKCFLFNW